MTAQAARGCDVMVFFMTALTIQFGHSQRRPFGVAIGTCVRFVGGM